jgi:hypothetical protein
MQITILKSSYASSEDLEILINYNNYNGLYLKDV